MIQSCSYPMLWVSFFSDLGGIFSMLHSVSRKFSVAYPLIIRDP